MTTPSTTQQPLLIDKHEVARMTTISTRTIERLVATGRFPQPVRLGRKRMWHRRNLEAWLANSGVSSIAADARDFGESRSESP